MESYVYDGILCFIAFEEAEKNAPAIIFIDELDAIAPKREKVSNSGILVNVEEFHFPPEISQGYREHPHSGLPAYRNGSVDILS